MSGCDSIVETYLTVDSVIYSYDSLSICSGDSALIAGNYVSIPGTYRDTLIAFGGCDSVAVMELTIIPTLANTIDSMGICTGDSALLAGVYQTTSGVYYDTLQTVSGCDSIVETYLIVDSVLYSYDTISICFGDSALISGNYYDQGGVYLDTSQSQYGCDSISTTVLEVRPYLYQVDTMYICTGDSAFLSGAYQYFSGVYYDSLQSVTGCDSVIESYLIVDTVLYSYETVELCFGDSLLIAGEYQSISGVYNDSLTAQAGCDSINVITLTVASQITVQDSLTICYGDSILIAGVYRDSAGTYIDSLQSIQGCDSIVTKTINLTDYIYQFDSVGICTGDSILLGGNYVSSSGIYLDTIVVNGSCDTVLSSYLFIHSVISDTLIITACNEFITGTNDTLTTSGIYTDTLTNVYGCDSIITYDLTINQYSISTLNDTSCGPYTSPAGNTYIASGFYTDTLTNSVGCDSLIIIQLTIYCNDIDGDGIPDIDDIDNDNDGISDLDEGTGDTDGDGIPDYLDIDSDNDGIYDVDESGNGDLDTNNDGVIDANDNGFADTNNNGMADDAESTIPLDTDGDGLANHLDLDSDNDGIYDVDEGGDGDQDTNNDGVVDTNDVGFSDNDNDGMADGTETTRPPDSDNDGYMDYVDLDADNDGIYDVVEGGDGDQDTNGDGMIDNNDTGFTDTNNNGMADNTESTPAPDTDNNMVPDYMDLDSDGDGCTDVVEAGFVDDDGDGYLGLSPTVEDSMGVVVSAPDGYTTPADNDGNGTPDFLEIGIEPVITLHPDDLYLYDEGDSIVMIAGVTPQAGVTYQWQYSDDDGNAWISIGNDTVNNTIFTGSNTNTLTLFNTGKQFDNYLFRIVTSTPGFTCGDESFSDNARIILREIFIPDGFSPNNDGKNDTWHITGIDRFPENHVEIYSRWEVKVFETDNYNSNNEWDGTDKSGTLSFGSGLVPEGTYFYIIDLGEGKASRKPIKGYVYIRKANR